MFNTSILVWIILLIIGVSDAKAHRIPNKLLVLLLLSLCLSTLTQTHSEALWPVFVDKCIAFGVTFVFGIALYVLRVMAPGDVKFVAVLGFYLGTGELVGYLYYVCLMITFVGPMYWFMNRLQLALMSGTSRAGLRQRSGTSMMGLAISLNMGKQELKRKISTQTGLAYMPFAPILVIGLALYQYYSG